MKRYAVMVPFAGHFYVEVEAENEQDAKYLAMVHDPLNKDDIATIEEMEYFEQMNIGNVSYLTLSEIDIQEIED